MSSKLATNWRSALRLLWIGLLTTVFMLVLTQAIMWYEYLYGTSFEKLSLADMILMSIFCAGVLVAASAWAVRDIANSSVVLDLGMVVISFGTTKYTFRYDKLHPLIVDQDVAGRYWLLKIRGDEAPAVRIPIGLFPTLKEFLHKEGVIGAWEE